VKIKDLPSDRSLGGVRFRFPGDGKIYFWHSQWQKGVWGKKHPKDTQVHPLHVEDLKDALEWEVIT
jgi:hypothetical protein